MKLFLEAQEYAADITVLTATTPTDSSLCGPPEEPETWPTFENVRSSLRRVFNNAKDGDVVYIHYSGHGTRLPSLAQSGRGDKLELALNTLRNKGANLTHQSVHEHLSTRFHVSWPRQTPMRYGNAKLVFFDTSLPAPDILFVSIKAEDDLLYLRAGYVHGVCEGDKYAVYPFDSPEHVNDQGEEAILNV